MTPEEHTELADRIVGAGTSALVLPDAEMSRNWVPSRRTAAEAAQGISLLPLTVSEARIAANFAAVLGGYHRQRAPRPDAWR